MRLPLQGEEDMKRSLERTGVALVSSATLALISWPALDAVLGAEAALAEARARLANAETEFGRAERMIANNTISQARFDQARAERQKVPFGSCGL